MFQKKISFLLSFIIIGAIVSCNTTKPAVSVDKQPIKKDNTVYNLMGNYSNVASKGIHTKIEYIAKENSVIKIGKNDGAQEVGDVTYFWIDQEFEESYNNDSISIYYIRDNFSLDYNLNGERQVAVEIGSLNGLTLNFTPTADNVWQTAKKPFYKPDQLLSINQVEDNLSALQGGHTVNLKKSFYPPQAKIGDSWPLLNDQLKWIFDAKGAVYDASGNMTLKEVVVDDTDSIAVIDFNFTINFESYSNQESPPIKRQLAFKGEIRRSLIHFVDNIIEMKGSYNIARIKPAEGNQPRLNIDVNSNGILKITEVAIE